MKQQGWKSDGEGSTAMESSAILQWILYSVLGVVTSRYTAQRVYPCKTLKGTGNLHELVAAASSRCRVVRTGPAILDRLESARSSRGRRHRVD